MHCERRVISAIPDLTERRTYLEAIAGDGADGAGTLSRRARADVGSRTVEHVALDLPGALARCEGADEIGADACEDRQR